MNIPDILAYQPPAWMDSALCAQLPPEMGDEWFQDVRANATAVKAVCGRCSVAAACLAYSLDNREEYGIWAGTTPADRDDMRLRGVA